MVRDPIDTPARILYLPSFAVIQQAPIIHAIIGFVDVAKDLVKEFP
jgi:hypothetical protein